MNVSVPNRGIHRRPSHYFDCLDVPEKEQEKKIIIMYVCETACMRVCLHVSMFAACMHSASRRAYMQLCACICDDVCHVHIHIFICM